MGRSYGQGVRTGACMGAQLPLNPGPNPTGRPLSDVQEGGATWVGGLTAGTALKAPSEDAPIHWARRAYWSLVRNFSTLGSAIYNFTKHKE